MSPVTIGIAFYNADSYLKFAILSVINQTFHNWRLVLLDDGSTDDSLLIANSFISDSRIRVYSDGKNLGLATRLNQLIEITDTQYFARMDSDDIMFPDRIQKQVDYLLAHEEIDIVGSCACSIDIANNICGYIGSNEEPRSIIDVLEHRCFIHPTIMGKTQWFKRNLYSLDFHRLEDEELWLRTINSSVFYNIQTPLLFYRDVGIPYLNKYLQSALAERRLIRIVLSCSVFLKIKFLFWNYLKTFIYIACSLLGCVNYLVSTRAQKIDFNDRTLYDNALSNAIKPV